MKDGTESKVKFRLLMRELDLAIWQAQGLVTAIWRFAKANTPAGDIGRFSDEEIALAIDWRDDAAKMVAALVKYRWLDAHPEHRLIVHDWHEHCEDAIHVSLARKREFFADGQVPKLTRFSNVDKAEITADYKRLCENRDSGNRKSRKSTQKPAPSLALPRLSKPSLASSCPQTDEPSDVPKESSPSLVEFPTDGTPKQWHLTQPVVDELAEAYPSLDILAEARRAKAWILGDPIRKKTAGGMRRFLTGWLGRSQNSGRASPSAKPVNSLATLTADDIG